MEFCDVMLPERGVNGKRDLDMFWISSDIQSVGREQIRLTSKSQNMLQYLRNFSFTTNDLVEFAASCADKPGPND